MTDPAAAVQALADQLAVAHDDADLSMQAAVVLNDAATILRRGSGSHLPLLRRLTRMWMMDTVDDQPDDVEQARDRLTRMWTATLHTDAEVTA